MYQTDPKHLYMRWENEEKKLLLFTAIILILKLVNYYYFFFFKKQTKRGKDWDNMKDTLQSRNSVPKKKNHGNI